MYTCMSVMYTCIHVWVLCIHVWVLCIHVWVLWISILPLFFTMFGLDFGIVSTVWYFLFFIFCFFLLNTIETVLFHSIVSLCLLHWMNILTYQYTILCTYNHHMSIHAPCGRVITNKYSIYIALNKPRSFGSLQYSYSCTCM